MTSTENCPKVGKCPIFQGNSFEGHELSYTLQNMYKRNYCEAGESKFITCKRYIAANQLGVPIPEMIMPNSTRSIVEIKQMIAEG